jgi:hypothetical protein
MPYLLSGLFDSDPDIQEAALEALDLVGLDWEREKEKDLKDLRQLGIDAPWTKGGRLADLPLPPPLKSRMRIGTRGFVRSQVRRMWGAIFKEVRDHNDETRLRASNLMLLGVAFSEEYMTQFLD